MTDNIGALITLGLLVLWTITGFWWFILKIAEYHAAIVVGRGRLTIETGVWFIAMATIIIQSITFLIVLSLLVGGKS